MPPLPRPSRFALCAVLVAASVAGAAPPAGAEVYRLDPVHTRIAFVVDHAGLSRAIGTFSGVQGRLEFSPDAWTDATVALTVPLATLDLGDGDWREAVLDGTFLDAGDFPEAHFVSTAVTPGGPDRARIAGVLTLRGVSRPVELDARLNAAKRHPITRRRSAGFSATATISRRAFGIDAWPNVVGDEISLMIEVEAILDPKASAPAAPAGGAAADAADSVPPTPDPADATDP
jgi:polyisoprenoid-binding protein YceI